jgi:hypothetical protein
MKRYYIQKNIGIKLKKIKILLKINGKIFFYIKYFDYIYTKYNYTSLDDSPLKDMEPKKDESSNLSIVANTQIKWNTI